MTVELAYLQRDPRTGEFLSEIGYCFWKGCDDIGIETKFFVPDEIDTLPLTRDTLVQGGIGMVRRAFTRLGVSQPTVGEMPPSDILPYYGRKLWATTMVEVREGYEDNRHFFIKPLRMHKEFTGHVTSGLLSDLAKTACLPNEFEILASEVVDFESEYRLFVHKRKVISARIYRGNFRKLVDFSVADAVLDAYKDQPVAFSLDLGLTKDGRTLVVEINDAFSLGTYGLGHLAYARMVVDRWEEIVGV